MDKNLNTTFDNSLEQDFNLAAKLCEQDYDYERFMSFLKDGNDVERQLAALEINEIKTQEDADVLVSNLTGQDGKIREAAAFKINQLIKQTNYSKYFNSKKVFGILLEGIMDINGNVCRQICEISEFNQNFRTYLAKKLPEEIDIILERIKNLSADEKQYKISKRNFQLYWSLEALCNCINEIDVNEIEKILFQTASFEDYTIREKTAKILSKINDNRFNTLKENLKNDTNYYVKRYLN